MTLLRTLLLAAPAVLALARPAPARTIADCLTSRYLVEGSALVVGDTSPSQPIVIAHGMVSIGSVCPPAAARYQFRPDAIVVRTVFPRCTGLHGRVRLTVNLLPECTSVNGRLRARRVNRGFSARLSVCGDGIVDAGGGEQCDRSSCEAGSACSTSCLCVPLPTTSTTSTTSPSTSSSTIAVSTTSTIVTGSTTTSTEPPGFSVARRWDEAALDAIRRDVPRPPVHARNLFHLSVAMWDAWAVYDQSGVARQYLTSEPVQISATPGADRNQAISFAAYRLLKRRYSSAFAFGAADSQAECDALMDALGYDKTDTSTTGSTPAAVGNRIAAALTVYGGTDGSNEPGYGDPTYFPANDPLVVAIPANTPMMEASRWQPLALAFTLTQNGIPIPDNVQTFIAPHWDGVRPWALVRTAPGLPYRDPGPPPALGSATDAAFKADFLEVVRASSTLDPGDGVTVDVSPAARGNDTLGQNDGTGYPVNPATGAPYASQVVKRGDWARVVAEYWANGPTFETPAGHWNVIANAVTDQLGDDRRFGGSGPALSKLEWDVKLYLALNGAEHDAAVASWGAKRYYDGVRPISAVRNMSYWGGPAGQPDYAKGLPLESGLVEMITSATTAPGQRHQAFRGLEGNIAIRSWPGQPTNPLTQASGVHWTLGVKWVPYQKNSFVTPAWAGYPSGTSTFARAAAEVLTGFTGTTYFPGGLGAFTAPVNDFLRTELGPTQTVILQWATYYDAADEAGLSGVFGGLETPRDDAAGRVMGAAIGKDAFARARQFYGTTP